MPSIGERREVLAIQRDSSTTQTVDGHSATWVPLAIVRAALIPQSAGEQVQGVSVGSQNDYRFVVTQRTDVKTTMQVLWTPSWGGSQQTLQITGVLPDGNGRQSMVLLCSQWGAA